MVSADCLSELLATLYAAPMSPELWRTFLCEFNQILGLHASAIISTDLTGEANSIFFSEGVDPAVEEKYAQHYGTMDVYRPRFLQMQSRVGDVLMGDELCPFEEMRNTAFYTDILHKADIRLWAAVATVHHTRKLEHISLYHPWNANPPDKESLELVRLVTPHIYNALRIRAQLSKLSGVADDFSAALDTVEFGMVLFDEKGDCSLLNRSAKQILDQRDGLCFSGARLIASSPDESARLRELIRKSIATSARMEPGGGGVIRITRRFGGPLHLRIAPFACERLEMSKRFFAIAFLNDPERKIAIPAQMLGALYDLTPAETRLALRLASGNSLSEAADAAHVTRETVRSQLKTIFQKTGTRRQSELVRIVTMI